MSFSAVPIRAQLPRLHITHNEQDQFRAEASVWSGIAYLLQKPNRDARMSNPRRKIS